MIATPATPIYLVLVTCPPDAAQTLAEALVSERLAACVNIVPQLQSVYRWEKDGSTEVRSESEALLIIKTPVNNFAELKQAILARHPYELPEILAVNPADGHAPYLSWILSSCQ
jgi:periplasmic divalent cation tolerance protein